MVGILSLAIGGCSGSGGGSQTGGSTSLSGSSGGAVASGGSGGGGGSGGSHDTGGSSSGAAGGDSGSGGSASTGGTTGEGGILATGGGRAGGGTAGGRQTGGGTGSGGQAGAGTGGAGQTGGGTGSGGQAGAGTGGAGQTGGGTGRGGQAGSGTGGNRQTGGTTSVGGQSGQRSISFGTLLDAQAVMSAARELAKSLSNPSSPQWQAKGDQHRSYRFAEANTNEPYRIYVPTNWDGESSLPLAMFLHGAGSDENSYLDQNNKQMINLAQEHGYLLVSPLGDKGAYGNFLRLSAPFGKPEEAAKLMAQVTPDSERTNELSEQDVINVLELVLSEYPVDRSSMFLFGHSMGSGGTWYIGGKYAEYWTGMAPMSGPFVQETGYPWDSVREISIFVTEGTQTPSLDGSRAVRDWLSKNGYKAEYLEVNADHGGMIKLVLPDIFDFFDRSR